MPLAARLYVAVSRPRKNIHTHTPSHFPASVLPSVSHACLSVRRRVCLYVRMRENWSGRVGISEEEEASRLRGASSLASSFLPANVFSNARGW